MIKPHYRRRKLELDTVVLLYYDVLHTKEVSVARAKTRAQLGVRTAENHIGLVEEKVNQDGQRRTVLCFPLP